MKRGKYAKKQNKFLIFIIFLSSIFIIYSLIKITMWFLENNKIKEEISKIEKDVIITKIENTEASSEEIMIDEKEIPDTDPYWGLKNVDYIQADFSNLIKTNKEVVAWISVSNTNINYPVVQHTDNEYYLNHTFNGAKNEAGWVFMDYRNTTQNLGKNTIIYAHKREDGTMFGSLENILDNSWYENKENYAIKTSTKYENNLWQVFSVYRIPTTSDYIQTDFQNDKTYQEFLNKIKKRSIYDFQTTVNTKNKILTLSTCYNRNERIVLHSKLIRSQKK